MKNIFIAITFLFSATALTQEKIKFNFPNEEITKIIEMYSKATGTKIVVDSTVRGKISLFNSNDISLEEAYNQLSEALALNGFSIIKKDDYSLVRNARSAQRDGIEVYTTLPAARPQRMATWIVTLKYISSDDMQRQIGRFMTSSYGEVQSFSARNQLVITDFTSTLNRVAEMIKTLDQPADSSLKKIIDENKANHKKMTDAYLDRKTTKKSKSENKNNETSDKKDDDQK